jgi:deoxyadenosine/deoxycytidine kinase|uniref:Deoxynucleoside kinase n=1 Tax=Caldisericum exile TaxID=693075 RepID=A0A7C4TVN4_9BACT
MRPKFIVAIAGNIGSGKSTLSRYLSEKWKFNVLPEPEAKNPFIKKFYKDPERWAFHSQLFFLVERANLQLKIEKTSSHIILDRTIYEDAEIFARLLLNENEFKIYKKIYEQYLELISPPNFVIYLRTSVDTLMERIKIRGRGYEKTIKKSYIKRLNEAYDEWIRNFSISPVLTIDTDKYEIYSLFGDIEEVRKTIEEFFWRMNERRTV